MVQLVVDVAKILGTMLGVLLMPIISVVIWFIQAAIGILILAGIINLIKWCF